MNVDLASTIRYRRWYWLGLFYLKFAQKCEGNEIALRKEFQPAMWEKDYSKWIYDSVNAKDRPADMEYYMGYKIVQSYYNNAKDKRQAIKDILEIKDVPKFLEASKYGEKFTK